MFVEILDSFPWYKEPGWKPLEEGAINYFALSFGFLLAEQAFELYLTFRQRKYLKRKEVPGELLEQADIVDRAVDAKLNAPKPQEMKREDQRY